MKKRMSGKEAVVRKEQVLKSKGFNVFRDGSTSVIRSYSRKDFYKVCMYKGEAVIEYADKGITINGPTLFFGTPHIPYSWEDVNKEHAYTCLFTEIFLKTNNNSESLMQSPLFKIGGTPIFHLNAEQVQFIEHTFERMIKEYSSEYVYKDDLMRNYINLVIHEALKMQPAENFTKHQHASARVSSLFLELLERQFPIESPSDPLRLKTAADYAQGLAIHVNHLNRSVKEVTGKSTTAHITDRIITEAKALLKHKDWTISEIAYSLGFEYPTYFNNYFKRYTGTNPRAFKG